MSSALPKTLDVGVFASPATGGDAPYKLQQLPGGEISVLCVESNTTFDTSVLQIPTKAEVKEQHAALIRELGAWLCTNGPANPAREQAAISEVSRRLQVRYDQSDLEQDRRWILSNDLSQRIPILQDALSQHERLGLVEFAAQVGVQGTGIAESDAQFIEYLGRGLGLDAEVVTETVVAAIQRPNAA